eukprot:XP_011669925.1 PREDICTED: fibropellin-1-like [Strongylocentrotus purpuratus]
MVILHLTISRNTDSPAFKGILLQARRTDTDQIIGTWSLAGTTGFQTLACNGANSAVTHTNNDDKPAAFQLNWTPPDVIGADIYVTATFVQTRPVFWVAERTSDIQDTCNANGANLCGANGNCESLIGGGINCICEEGYTGILCTMGPCDSDPCVNGGTCTYSAGDTTFTCSCPPPLGGPTCQTEIDPCANNSCENGATCNPMPNSVNYTCECVIGFSGERCETEINPCDNNSCENGASCNTVVGFITNYTCECPTGFRGEFCEMEIDPCANNSCANGATCKPMPNSVNYTCECVIGFSGERCKTEINPCDNNSCENGASCNTVVGSITNYTCECPTGFSGKFCELEIDPCANNSCENGATCKPMPNSVNYTCECVIGFSGERCEIEINPCDNNSCENGASCNTVVGSITNYTCECPTGFNGKFCELEINPCDNNSCENGASCNTVVGSITNYTCECPTGFSGKFCELEINPCDNNSCENGASCNTVVGSITNYTCECPTGFSGKFCELEIDPCANNSCANGATCNPMPNSVNYTCECVIGFSGERCETEINPCDNNSCENGASCNKVVGSITNYTCECPTGFRGEFCELEIDPCANNSCANGATCKPMPNSVNYTCECVIGFSGERCEIEINPCDNNSCENGASCNTVVGSITNYTCECPTGFSGEFCEMVQDLCNGNLCENEAGCTSAPGANPPYTCQCQAGFSGFFCGTDNCITNNDWICNNGTCETIQGGGIRCNCFEGFTGTVCDQKSTTTTPCNPDPCKNEGVCAIRGDTWYTCTCPATYVGTNCDIPAPCNPSLCQNGGTCTVTGTESYSCACPPLYTGNNCQTSVTSSGDTFPPVVSNCPSDIVRTVPAGTVALMVSWVEPTANDNVGVQTFESSVPSGTNFPADTTTNVQYTATDFSGNSDTSCSFTVRVTTEADITPPTVEGCPTDIVHTVTPGTSSRPVTWNEPTATDDGSGLESFTSSATSGTNFPADTTTTVVYRAVDNAGNEDRSCEFTVRIITSSNGADTVPPIITNCPADIVITALPGQQGVEASWIAPSASDSSGVLSLTPNIPSGTTFSVGFTATIVYTATDNLGNTDDTTCRFTITILSSSGPSVDTTPPTVNNCPLDFTINANAEEQVAPVTWSSPTAFDASGVASITSIPVSGSLLPVGEATIVTFSVADNVGNIDISCRFVATVAASSSADTTLPTITGCPGDITDTALSGEDSLSVTWDEPQASDASGIQSFTPNIPLMNYLN